MSVIIYILVQEYKGFNAQIWVWFRIDSGWLKVVFALEITLKFAGAA